jgi:hypothetical protein
LSPQPPALLDSRNTNTCGTCTDNDSGPNMLHRYVIKMSHSVQTSPVHASIPALHVCVSSTFNVPQTTCTVCMPCIPCARGAHLGARCVQLLHQLLALADGGAAIQPHKLVAALPAQRRK